MGAHRFCWLLGPHAKCTICIIIGDCIHVSGAYISMNCFCKIISESCPQILLKYVFLCAYNLKANPLKSGYT